MELLANSHLWVIYETPSPPPQLKGVGIKRLLLAQQQSGLLVGAIALLTVSTQAQARVFPGAGTAYISPPPGYNLNIRNGPGTQYLAINTLSRGTPIALTGEYSNGWAQLANGGWAAGNLINSIPPNIGGPTDTVYTAYIATPVGYNANIRNGPSAQSAAVNTLSRGTAITVTGRYENGWAQLTDGNWVAGNLIQVGQPVAAPVSDPTPPPSTTSPPPRSQPGYLRFGSRGADVTELQERLQVLGYLPAAFTPNGVFGETTTQAVGAFQQRNGLLVDGVAGPQTLEVLYSDAAIANLVDDGSPDTPSSPSPSPDPSDEADPVPSDSAADEPPTDAEEPPTDAEPTPPDQSSAQAVQISTDTGMEAIVFSGPGTENELVGYIPNGTTVQITGQFENGWAELENGTWIYAGWLDFGESETVPEQ